MLDLADVTPYLHILAPTSQSGKTTLGEVLKLLAARPLSADAATGAVVRRILDEEPPPTLFADELDEVFKKRVEDTADLRQVLNLGYRRGATVIINVPSKGQGWTPQSFKVFGPKVLISIGQLAEATESRSIPVSLQRQPKTVMKKKFRIRQAEAEVAPLHAELSMLDVPAELPVPEMPEELSGRQQDMWESLFMIADWLGGRWPAEARAAAIELHSAHVGESQSIALLRHIREIFQQPEHIDAAGLYTIDLLRELLANEEWPYRHIEGNRPLDAYYLSAKLKAFNIEPLPIRTYQFDSKQRRGYYRVAFEDAWSRYL
jgi:hypothetical protein